MLTDFAWQAAVVGGIGLAMSSTAMALQLMRDKGMNRTEGGQLGFSVLLFQDLAVIPALAMVPLLAGNGDEHPEHDGEREHFHANFQPVRVFITVARQQRHHRQRRDHRQILKQQHGES